MTSTSESLAITVGKHLEAILNDESNYWSSRVPETQAQGGQCHTLAALIVLACSETPLRIEAKRNKAKTIKPKVTGQPSAMPNRAEEC